MSSSELIYQTYRESCLSFCQEYNLPYGMSAVSVIFLILSNICFIPAAAIVFGYREYLTGIVLTCSYVQSVFYHMCLGGFFCFVELPVLMILDVYWSTLSIVAISLYLVGHGYVSCEMREEEISRQGAMTVYLVICSNVILIMTMVLSHNTILVAVTAFVLAVIPLVVVWGVVDGTHGFVSRYRWKFIPPALIFAAISFVFYYLGSNSDYAIYHSLWHLCISLSVLFIVLAKKEHPRRYAERNM